MNKLKYILSFLLIVLLFTFCSKPKSDTDETEKLDIIQIQFYPSMYIRPSIITYYLSDNKVFLQRIGERESSYPPPPPGANFDAKEWNKIHDKLSSNYSYYSVNKETTTFIQDSIINNFTERDFTDQADIYITDGFFDIIVFVYNNAKTIDIELINNGTENQYKLIHTLLDYCIENEKDSVTLSYLNQLKKFQESL